jgi:hypothetical protein
MVAIQGLPTIFMAAYMNPTCQSLQTIIPTHWDPSNTENDTTFQTRTPNSTWLYIASPCTGTGASRLCRQDEKLLENVMIKLFSLQFYLSPLTIMNL